MKGARLLFVGFEGKDPTPAERRILRRLQPGGIVLVPRNIGEETELRALVAELRELCPRAILALDAEGGRVDRLRNLTGPAPAAADLAHRPPVAARRAGRWIGAALREFGFELDFAPVVDLDHGKTGNALDRRCLGSTPRQVTTRAKGFIEGLEESGVGACLKHWPGLGAAGADTHLAPACIEASQRELSRDAEPFRRLAGDAGAVMVGHAIYPALDAERRPASLSPALVGGALRRGLPFRGVVFSDDLEMGALAAWGDLAELGEAALVAGCDGLLFCRQLEATPEIAARLARPKLASRREAAERRLEALRRRLARLRRAARPTPSLATIRRRLAALDRA